jgi:glutamate-1-semialdehyde 2,1-aminomutase
MQLTDSERLSYEAFRGKPPDAVPTGCSAPFVTMSFHPTGKVLACSRKPATVLGDIRTQRLDEIWQSPARRALMAKLRCYDYSGPGCRVCGTYIAAGDYVTADAVRTYDMETVREADPQWPRRLEFNLANTCGLQCVMCSGEYSSAIRALREKLPPLPRVYGDQFFLDLRPYLAHVSCCVYLGGEPFSQQECYRIWDLAIEDGSKALHYVNTNGMVWSPRVERVVDALRMVIAISFDGATAATVEAARVGASFPTMLQHAKEFGRRVGKNGGDLVFNFCPMRSNWREFPDFLLLAEDHGARGYINTMVAPEELSLYFLPRGELQAVIGTLEERGAALGSRLQRTRPALDNLLAMLRHKLHTTDREALRVALATTEADWRGEPVHVEDAAAGAAIARAADYVERGRRVLASPSYIGTLAVHHARGIYPFYSEQAQGVHFRDPSGRQYLDWYMSGGAVALGHNHPVVVDAVRRQLDLGMNLSQPATLEVEVAEQLCAMIPTAEQVAFGKNGTDVVGAAVRAARIATGRERVLVCGYHGFQDWSLAANGPTPGIPAAYGQLVLPYRFNDLASAAALLEQHRGQVAAIVLEPVRYEDPKPEFLHGLRQLADQHGALLIFDEIVTCFRTARGGIQQLFGVRPDLTCVAKAIANGLPLAAVVGARRWMRCLADAHFGMTYRWDGLAFAAARATLAVFEQVDVSAHLRTIGEALRTGFAAAAARHGLDWQLTAQPSMLHLRLQGGGRLTQRGAEDLFMQVCLRRGVVLRMQRILPSLAHTPAHVEQTLDVVDEAMRTVRRAMERGLEGIYDGPIWPGVQLPAAAPAGVTAGGPAIGSPPVPAVPKPKVRASTLATALPSLPAAVRGGGLWASVTAADPAASVHGEGAAVVLGAEVWTHATPVCCQVDVPEPVTRPRRLRAHYALDRLPRQAAFVSVQLVVTEPGGVEASLRHDILFGERPASRFSVGSKTRQAITPYGVPGGVLELCFDDGQVHATHTTEWADPLGALPFVATGPLRVAFRLFCSLAGGPVRVRLLDLEVQ